MKLHISSFAKPSKIILNYFNVLSQQKTIDKDII